MEGTHHDVVVENLAVFTWTDAGIRHEQERNQRRLWRIECSDRNRLALQVRHAGEIGIFANQNLGRQVAIRIAHRDRPALTIADQLGLHPSQR